MFANIFPSLPPKEPPLASLPVLNGWLLAIDSTIVTGPFQSPVHTMTSGVALGPILGHLQFLI